MRRRLALCLVVFLFVALNALAQVSPAIIGGMKWRQIGPFRGGRVLAVTGVPGDPYTYYFGAVAGGVWKSTNGGVSWTPIFDQRAISSIGAIAVADTDHNVIYVGTRRGLPARQHLLRRRSLQVDRRRQDVEATSA